MIPTAPVSSAAAGKFRFAPDFPATVLAEVKRHLLPLAGLLPGWCDHVNVCFLHDAPGDSNCEIICHYDYRWASLRVCPAWLTEDNAIKRESLAHELLHITLCPLADFARDMVRRLVPEEDAKTFHGLLAESVRERVEMVTQDLAYLFLGSKAGRVGEPAKAAKA